MSVDSPSLVAVACLSVELLSSKGTLTAVFSVAVAVSVLGGMAHEKRRRLKDMLQGMEERRRSRGRRLCRRQSESSVWIGEARGHQSRAVLAAFAARLLIRLGSRNSWEPVWIPVSRRSFFQPLGVVLATAVGNTQPQHKQYERGRAYGCRDVQVCLVHFVIFLGL